MRKIIAHALFLGSLLCSNFCLIGMEGPAAPDAAPAAHEQRNVGALFLSIGKSVGGAVGSTALVSGVAYGAYKLANRILKYLTARHLHAMERNSRFKTIPSVILTATGLYFVAIPLLHYSYAHLTGQRHSYFEEKLREAVEGYIKVWAVLKVVQLSVRELLTRRFDNPMAPLHVEQTNQHVRNGHEVHREGTRELVAPDRATTPFGRLLLQKCRALGLDALVDSHAGALVGLIHPDRAGADLSPLQQSFFDLNDYHKPAVAVADDELEPDAMATVMKNLNIYCGGYNDLWVPTVIQRMCDSCARTLWCGGQSLCAFDSGIKGKIRQNVAQANLAQALRDPALAANVGEQDILPVIESVVTSCRCALTFYRGRIRAYQRMVAIP